MRILWYNWRDLKNPAAGGAEVFTHEVCKRLSQPTREGHKITLFTASFKGCKIEEEIDGIRIIRRGNRYSVYKQAKKFYQEHEDEFDLVIDEINTRPFLTPTFVKDKPIIALIHQLAREFWFFETPFPVNLIGYLFLEKYWLRKYTNIPTITISNSTIKDLKELGFQKVHLVPQGLNFKQPTRQSHKEGEPTLIFVGRLKKAKRPDHAIKAFMSLKAEVPDAKLWVVGNGYMLEELKKIAGKMSNTRIGIPSETNSRIESYGDITFFGGTDNDTKLDLMSRAHILLVPGVREGWGLVVTEANSLGTTAVAYDVPGLRDSVIDNQTGMLVQKDDYVGMGIEAAQLFKESQRLKQLSTNAREHSKQFDWESTTAEFSLIIDSVMKSTPKTQSSISL